MTATDVAIRNTTRTLCIGPFPSLGPGASARFQAQRLHQAQIEECAPNRGHPSEGTCQHLIDGIAALVSAS